MKKCLSLVIFCLLGTAGFAQSSFYLSAQGGPSFAFSNSSSPFNPSNKKLTANYGVSSGYEFPNQLLKAEIGVYRTNIYSIFGLNDHNHNRGKDRVYLSRDSWQIPLRFKLKFWQPTEKITFRAITGIVLSLTPDDFKLKGDLINVRQDGGKTTFQTPASAEQNATYLFYGGINSGGIGAVDSNWLIESSLEMSCKLTDKLSGQVGLVYQGGIQTEYNGVIYETYTDPTSGKTYISSELQTCSEASALNLNFGLTYTLGK